jgi:2,3-bisphosphoglycerate-independent phosphoglycerate mutase
LDGRDVPPKTALGDIKELDAFCRENGNAQIATVSGRYYAMDRDNRWDRIKLAFEAITKGVATYTAPDAETAVSEAYGRGETDEFVKSTIIIDSEGNPETIIKDNDSVIFFNFRSDRARQLTWAFVKKDFEGASRGKNVRMFTMSVWSNMMKP